MSTKANIDGDYEYIPRLYWTNDSKNIAIQTLNRKQNNLKIHLINVSSNVDKVIIEEEKNGFTKK